MNATLRANRSSLAIKRAAFAFRAASSAFAVLLECLSAGGRLRSAKRLLQASPLVGTLLAEHGFLNRFAPIPARSCATSRALASDHLLHDS